MRKTKHQRFSSAYSRGRSTSGAPGRGEREFPYGGNACQEFTRPDSGEEARGVALQGVLELTPEGRKVVTIWKLESSVVSKLVERGARSGGREKSGSVLLYAMGERWREA